jgi:uncharacterized protein
MLVSACAHSASVTPATEADALHSSASVPARLAQHADRAWHPVSPGELLAPAELLEQPHPANPPAKATTSTLIVVELRTLMLREILDDRQGRAPSDPCPKYRARGLFAARGSNKLTQFVALRGVQVADSTATTRKSDAQATEETPRTSMVLLLTLEETMVWAKGYELSFAALGLSKGRLVTMLVAFGCSACGAASVAPPPTEAAMTAIAKEVSMTQPNSPPSSPIEERAKTFVGELAQRSWEHPKTMFDAAMASAMPPAKVEAAWNTLETAGGAFLRVERTQLETQNGYRIALVTCGFARGERIVKVVYDEKNQVAGLFFLPVPPSWTPPPYADATTFEEQEVKVGATPALPGTLTRPKGPGPFPAVLLVHGSGPSDRDESIGGMKPFKDLAFGLASRGVAVLRYEKRTRVFPTGVVTQKEEVLDAVHDAIELLAHTPGIDASRLYVIGHSQGGYLVPRIAESIKNLAGVAILAGNTRPLEDLIVDQFAYFASLEPKNPKTASLLEAARRFKQIVEDAALRADQEVELPTGGTAKGAYFLDVRGYDPAATARSLRCKILVLQGERDYQVTRKDYDGWRAALASRKNVTLKTYPSANHLFASGAGTPSPAEYELPSHVDAIVVEDLARFVLGQP